MIFEEQISRKPDYYPWTNQFIDAMHNGFWVHTKFKFNSDVQDFRVNLTSREREIVTRALATIGQIEVSVKTFWAKVGDNLPHPSIKDLGYVMANVEVIHGRAYEKLLSVLGIEDIFEEILKLDIIKGRDTYLRKHLHKFHSDNKKQFIYALILFTIFVENISLFSQFYTINWFGRAKNVLKDTNKQVEYTSREEDLHAKVGIKLVNEIRKEYPELFDEQLEQKITSEAEQAVKYEIEILKWILGDYNETGDNKELLNVEVLENFIKKRMNDSLIEIGYKTIFEVNDEILKQSNWFYEQLLGNNQSDFFHSSPVEYSKAGQSFDEDLF